MTKAFELGPASRTSNSVDAGRGRAPAHAEAATLPLEPAEPGRSLLALQRSAGNRAVVALLGAGHHDGRTGVNALAGLRRDAGGRLRRRIGPEQAGKRVKHNESGAEYVAHEIEGGQYELQPLGAGDAVTVDPTDDDYELAGELDTKLATVEEEPERRNVARMAAQGMIKSVEQAMKAQKFERALTLLQSVAALLATSSTPEGLGAKPMTSTDLDKHLGDTIGYGKVMGSVYRAALFLSPPEAAAAIKGAVSTRDRGLKSTYKDAFKGGVPPDLGDTLVRKFEACRTAPELVPSLVALVKEREVATKKDEIAAYNKEVPALLGKKSFQAAYLGMAEARSKVKGDAAPVVEGPEAAQKAALLRHLGVEPTESEPGSLFNTILGDYLLNTGKAERLKHVLEEDPAFLEQCRKAVTDQEIHATLASIKGGKPHSITNINDYVGDKLNDPLMRWILDKKIPVEVHATSALTSLVALKQDGFTDVIEIPSAHEGTKKYVASNPSTGKAKVVFQTLPGASYAIQTAGQFLFYELYKVLAKETTKTVPASPYVHEGYKARNMLSKTESAARYLLLAPGSTAALIAEVPYVGKPPKIGDKGEIMLEGVGEQQVKLTKVEVETLPADQLKILKEDMDWPKLYADVLRDSGIVAADIACIGRKAELTKALATFEVEPDKNVVLPYFNVRVFRLKKKDGGTATVLSFQISPDFFGDRAGALATALKTLGVAHVTFIGTAGGLGEGIAKGDTVVPETYANYADSVLRPHHAQRGVRTEGRRALAQAGWSACRGTFADHREPGDDHKVEGASRVERRLRSGLHCRRPSGLDGLSIRAVLRLRRPRQPGVDRSRRDGGERRRTGRPGGGGGRVTGVRKSRAQRHQEGGRRHRSRRQGGRRRALSHGRRRDHHRQAGREGRQTLEGPSECPRARACEGQPRQLA